MTINEQPGARFHLFGSLLRVLSALVILGFAAWGALALFCQFPGAVWLRMAAAMLWVVLSLTALFVYVSRRSRLVVLVYPAMIAALLFWWDGISASNTRDWADEASRMTSGVVNGSEVTLANVRNFDWRTASDYTAHWENRTYDLDTLASLDLILPDQASPAIASPLVSFGFENGNFVTFSVEARREKNESASRIGGFFKEYEAGIIAADERDSIRLLTNIRRQGVTLYRIDMRKPTIRALFMAYVDQANNLVETPRFYNTLTSNYATVSDMVSRIVPDQPLDYRLLFSSTLPYTIAEVNGFIPGLTLEQLREGGAIGARAQAADAAPDFSQRIRAGVPGIAPLIQP